MATASAASAAIDGGALSADGLDLSRRYHVRDVDGRVKAAGLGSRGSRVLTEDTALELPLLLTRVPLVFLCCRHCGRWTETGRFGSYRVADRELGGWLRESMSQHQVNERRVWLVGDDDKLEGLVEGRVERQGERRGLKGEEKVQSGREKYKKNSDAWVWRRAG